MTLGRLARVVGQGTIVAVVLALGWAHGRYIGDYDFFTSSRLAWTIAFVALLVFSSYAVGLPDEPAGGYRWAFGAAAAAGGIATTGISIAQLLLGSPLLPRFVVLFSLLFSVSWYWLWAAVLDDVRRRSFTNSRIVVVADSTEVALLQKELAGPSDYGAKIVTAVETDLHEVSNVDLTHVVQEARADVVVLDRNAFSDESLVSHVVAIHRSGTRVRTLSMFYEQWLQKLPVSELERVSLLFDIRELHNHVYSRAKRGADLFAGFGLGVATVVCVPFIAVANRFGNRGGLLFRQGRVGRNGKTFTLYKFRTMRESADTTWTVDNDMRVTTVGRFLRRTHVDELPQAWNILRGDLSLVGPRPEQPHYVEELEREIPFYEVRHLVRPGLTGWAQVRHTYAATVSEARQKLQYDFYYLRHQGLGLDIRILQRTVRSIVRRRGR